MARVMRRRRIRYQRLGRLRRNSRQFLAWLREQAERLSLPLRVLRDRLRLLGPLYASQVEAAEDAGDLGVVTSSAATVDLVRIVADDTDAPFAAGARCAAPVTFGQAVATQDLQIGATSGALTLDFVDGGAEPDTIVRAAGSFLDDGFRPGATIALTGTDEGGNAGPFVLTDVTDLELEVATGSLTADTGDTGVTVTSLNVITGFVPGPGFVSGALLDVLDGDEAGTYTVEAAGADFVVVDNGSPFSAVDTDYDGGLALTTSITRASGSFVDEGFRAGDTLTVVGGDNAGTYSLWDVQEGVLQVEEAFTALGPDSAAAVAVLDRISRGAGDFEADGFAQGMDVFVDGALAGVADSFSEGGDDMILAEPMPLHAAGPADVVASRSSIVRASGSFLDDGFADGDRVLLVGSDANDGEYTVHDAAALALELDGDRFLDSEDDAEAELFVVNSKGR